MGFKKPSTEVTNYVDRPGWFHVVVTGIEINPVYEGEQKDYVNLRTTILSGTEPSQVKRTATLRMTNPNEGQKDGGEFCFKTQCRAAAAMDIWAVITNDAGEPQYCEIDKVPEGMEMDIDWLGPDHLEDPENKPSYCIGKQMIVQLHEEEYNGKKSIKLNGAHLYHIGDPDVAHVPLDVKALAAAGYKLPEKVANSPGTPGAGGAGANGGAAGAAAGGAKKPTKAAKPSTPSTPAANKTPPVGAGAAAGSAANGAYDDL